MTSDYRPRLTERRVQLLLNASLRQAKSLRKLAGSKSGPARERALALATEYAEIAALLTDRAPGNPHLRATDGETNEPPTPAE